jgi:glycosyltransferase involved in cell wall biosynthesis
MEDNKKVVLFQSDFALVKSGFGRNTRAILTYLHNTGKYKIISYCCGMQWSNPELSKTPWKSVGCLPDNPAEIDQLNRDPHLARNASYGDFYLDKVISEYKPDVFFGVQDFWGVDFAVDRPWFSKVNSVIWTTLDSLPLYKAAVEKAAKIKNYWVWASFAENEMKKLGYNHVKTVPGTFDSSKFFKLPLHVKKDLRKKFGLQEDAFVVGFVFRNQLRKSVHQLIEGYKIWKTQHPEIKNTYLLLHTHFAEGWPITEIAEEYGVNHKEILTTYICRNCKEYQVKTYDDRPVPFEMNGNIMKLDGRGQPVPVKIETQDKDCPYCRAQKAQITTNVSFGVTEEQLNEVYNLMDVYIHPITSGGLEIPAIEAKFAEIPSAVTNYSCGEDLCKDGAGAIALDWAEYREFGTNFRKSSTYPSSIAKAIHKLYSIGPEKRAEIGKQARKWASEHCGTDVIGKKFEEFIDACQPVDWSKVSMDYQSKNPNAQISNIEDDRVWLKTLYKDILNMDVEDDDSGLNYWLGELNKVK